MFNLACIHISLIAAGSLPIALTLLGNGIDAKRKDTVANKKAFKLTECTFFANTFI